MQQRSSGWDSNKGPLAMWHALLTTRLSVCPSKWSLKTFWRWVWSDPWLLSTHVIKRLWLMCQHVNEHGSWCVPISRWFLVSRSQCDWNHHSLFPWTMHPWLPNMWVEITFTVSENVSFLWWLNTEKLSRLWTVQLYQVLAFIKKITIFSHITWTSLKQRVTQTMELTQARPHY